MPTAYVLINCKLGEEARIIRELRKIDRVADAHGVYGIYDVIAEVRGDATDDLKDIATRVRRISGILSTNTLIIVEGQG